ncbi:MAG: protein kinase [bacterium]|nr:protein kinase [bacterium]
MAERQIGNYIILKQIGVGGMAKVYLATHKDVPNLKVVLKVLSNSQHADRFMQEADKLALLDGNPNICQIRHFFEHEDELVIAMEHIDGLSLEEMIEREGSFSIPEVLKIITDLLAGLAPAHSRQIYHRDLKPGNIMFDKGGVLKIIDFGIAKGKADPQMTIVGTATGTPEYMAPEQFTGGEDLDYSKCDIYAVGTLLYRLIAGELPFKGDNEFVLRDAKMFDEPPVPSSLREDISREFDDIILKAIAKDPEARFSSIDEMRTELLRRSTGQDDVGGGPAPETMAAVVPEPIAPDPPTSKKQPEIPRTSRAVAGGDGRNGKRGFGKIAGTVIGVAFVSAVAIFGLRVLFGGVDAPPGGDRSDTILEPGATMADTTVSEDIVPSGDGADPISPPPPDAEPGRAESTTGAERPAVREEPVARVVEPGILLVSSRPGFAAVFINGERQSELTPFSFERPPGQYTVRIVKVVNGQERVHTETVTVTSDKTTKVSHNFEQ